MLLLRRHGQPRGCRGLQPIIHARFGVRRVGIPVGLLADDGTVYMVLKFEGSDPVVGGATILEVQTDRLVADGILYERDGLNYIVVEKVVANEGITNQNHEDFGVVPGFAIPGLN